MRDQRQKLIEAIWVLLNLSVALLLGHGDVAMF